MQVVPVTATTSQADSEVCSEWAVVEARELPTSENLTTSLQLPSLKDY